MMKITTLGEAVNYYHSLEKFGIMPGLERIRLLSERLGSPHKKLKFIHVAGTNGKGSTCTALASVLHNAGYKTGLYTSPYVIDFRERIQLGMRMISSEDLISCTEKVKNTILKNSPTIIHNTFNTIFLILLAMIPIIAQITSCTQKNVAPTPNCSLFSILKPLIKNASGINNTIEEIIHQRFFLILLFIIYTG